MVVCAWGCSPCKVPITSMPLRLKLSNVHDCYWTNKGLSSLASIVGRPLSADNLTSQLDVLPFAKMCVQYNYGDPLPNSIPVMAIDPC